MSRLRKFAASDAGHRARGRNRDKPDPMPLTRCDAPVRDCPLCPGCGHAMELTRVIPKGSYRTEQEVFQCRGCRVALTQAGEQSTRTS